MYQFPADIFLAMFAFMAVAAIAGMVSEYKKRKMELEPLRAAIERGQQLDPAIIERLMAREKQEEVKPVQLRIGGIISIAAGIGLSLLSPTLNGTMPRAVYPVFGVAFGAWLRQLAINTWLNHLRAAPAPMQSTDASADAVGVEQSMTPTPGEALDLDRALAHLARDERLCIVLAYNEGMSHSEIIAATALPLGTVKSHIKRGTERLRTVLDAYQPSEGNRHVR